MPVAILKFKLPEEQQEYRDCINGLSYLVALEGMDDYLRERIKYGNLEDKEEAIYQEIRNKLYQLRATD